jgi:hypothetical protein
VLINIQNNMAIAEDTAYPNQKWNVFRLGGKIKKAAGAQ